MTEECDEDVVFENSPLFQYLHDLGHTDFEACPTASQEDDYGGQEGDPTSPDQDPHKTSGGRLCRLAEALWRCSPIHQAAASHKLGQQLDCVFGQYSVSCILQQDVLLQEDVELIELLDPSLLTLDSSSRANALPRPSLIATPSIWDVAGLVGLAAVLLGLCSAWDGPWSLAAAPWGLAMLGWVGLRGYSLWRRGRMQRDVHTRAMQLQSLVLNSKTLTGLSRKALRLVQETEVISRGFTLVSAASSFSRAGPGAMPRGQHLIGLRKALYRALRSAFRASRRATCHMLKAFPLNSEIDNVTNYVSAVPLKELGLGLGIEHLGDEQAQELTDDYSLPALKMLFQLWVGQSSECYRRLALLLSPQRIEEESEEVVAPKEREPSSSPPLPPAPPTLLHRSIAAVTEPLHHALSSCLGEVQRSYDFHRHFETQLRSTGSDRTGRAREKCRELNTLHTSIRSLQLHLKALLSEMIILEDDLEKLMVSKEVAELTLEGYQDISERLQQLQPHMQASSGCWEDTLSQVQRMLRRANNTCPGNAEGLQQCGPPLPAIPDAPPSYPLILDKDPVPEELEWEAYVSDSESDGEGHAPWTDMLSPEERERQKREREESRRVLSELKAVLGFRASDGERMKRKQMLFNDQAAASAHSENSDTPTNLADAPTSLESAESVNSEGNHLLESERSAGNPGVGEEVEADDGGDIRARPDPSTSTSTLEPGVVLTEFSCGQEAEEGDLGKAMATSVCARGGGGASELHQYDGVVEEGGGEKNGLDLDSFLLKPKPPAVTVMERLTELHGSQALSFSSALAAQVAARSHALVAMTETTFGDDDDDDEEEDGEEQGDRRTT